MSIFSRTLESVYRQHRAARLLHDAVRALTFEHRSSALPQDPREPKSASSEGPQKPAGDTGPGRHYEKPQLAMTDPAQVIAWMVEVANLGDMHAQYMLGLIFQRGAGVAKDESVAAAWFRKAAEQGLAAQRKQAEPGGTSSRNS